jgi:hypothetical protein
MVEADGLRTMHEIATSDARLQHDLAVLESDGCEELQDSPLHALRWVQA